MVLMSDVDKLNAGDCSFVDNRVMKYVQAYPTPCTWVVIVELYERMPMNYSSASERCRS